MRHQYSRLVNHETFGTNHGYRIHVNWKKRVNVKQKHGKRIELNNSYSDDYMEISCLKSG